MLGTEMLQEGCTLAGLVFGPVALNLRRIGVAAQIDAGRRPPLLVGFALRTPRSKCHPDRPGVSVGIGHNHIAPSVRHVL